MRIKNSLPFLSLIIPCRNEEKYIGMCLDSLIRNTYPMSKLEVLIVDGSSEDGTRNIVKKYTHKYPSIKLLDNIKRITPVAMNIGIKNAKGSIIMKIDAHTTYDKDYISNCVKYLEEYKADNIGGILKIVPQGNTTVDKAIVFATSHPFGVGNSYFRIGTKEPRWVDTVSFGCYKKEVFEKIGLYNEDLARSQDIELNLRLKKSDGKILLHPEIVGYYHAKTNFKAFCIHKFWDGVWAIYPLKFAQEMPVSLRHLVPFAFVISLFGTGILSILSPIFLWIFLFEATLYSVFNLYFSVQSAIRERKLKLLFIMPLIFASLHISYGIGSLWGLLKASGSKRFWKNLMSLLKRK